jgi:hypothetical protein
MGHASPETHALCSTAAAAKNRAPAPDDGGSDSGFTVSARTAQGRVLITVTGDALRKLQRPGLDASLLSVLARHMPRFHALALAMASCRMASHVVIEAKDISWSDDEIEIHPDDSLLRTASGLP